MILFEAENRVLRETLLAEFGADKSKAGETDIHLLEFDDVRYRLQVIAGDIRQVLLSMHLPATDQSAALPDGAVEAVQNAFGSNVTVAPVQEAGFHITLEIHPPPQSESEALAGKLAAVRSVVMGAPLRKVLKALAARSLDAGASPLIAIPHRPKECFYAIPQADQVTVVFPMNFRDTNDVVLANAFLQEFMEARRHGSLSSSPPCSYKEVAPVELQEASAHLRSANAGYFSFVIFPHHVEEAKLEKTVWILSTFYAYVSYHIKCSKAFMHTRMRRRVDSLIQGLSRAQVDGEKEKKTAQGKTFRRPTDVDSSP